MDLYISLEDSDSNSVSPCLDKRLGDSENAVVPHMVPETLHQLASILRDPLLRRLVYEWDALPQFVKQAIAGLMDGVVDRD